MLGPDVHDASHPQLNNFTHKVHGDATGGILQRKKKRGECGSRYAMRRRFWDRVVFQGFESERMNSRVDNCPSDAVSLELVNPCSL